ncbi:hypothetical protein EYC84_007519 [Monilinia fructicola]|uniref:Uncharacterized protein n=1 Tax=Monilinia fructicola TaxID=38448 RepID=A0A5M9JG10_MONFR|nr:hypothetical protein EYC84_007519 [Monilinia fructicola]
MASRMETAFAEKYGNPRGFTARELESIGALADSRPGKWDYDSLDRMKDLHKVPIHPILDRKQWERDDNRPLHFPKHSYGDGNKFWEVKGNDDIWEALQPALRITSLVLSTTITWQWFDALLDGMYEIIPDDQIPDEYKDSLNYLRFFPSVKVSDRDKLDKHMKFLDDMHSMCAYLSSSNENWVHEPYFMEEPLAETGFSMQTAWFMALQHPDFWSLYLRSYGPKATHMGPKIVGLWEMAENNSFEASLRGFEDTTPIDLSSLDSRHDIRVAQMENNRRRRVKQIMDKSLGIQPLKREFYEYLSADRPGISNRAPFEGLVCPRYDEIKQYFEDNKVALALGTMDFLIPSPLLRSYVINHGGINLTASEWTTFFKVANDNNELFSYSNAGHGMIGLLKTGWTKEDIPIPRRGSILRRVSLRRKPSSSKQHQPPHPGVKLAKIFAWLCQSILQDLDLQGETQDACKNFFARAV